MVAIPRLWCLLPLIGPTTICASMRSSSCCIGCSTYLLSMPQQLWCHLLVSLTCGQPSNFEAEELGRYYLSSASSKVGRKVGIVQQLCVKGIKGSVKQELLNLQTVLPKSFSARHFPWGGLTWWMWVSLGSGTQQCRLCLAFPMGWAYSSFYFYCVFCVFILCLYLVNRPETCG